MNPTKYIYIQQAQLQRYLLECISQPLQLISAQSNAHAQTGVEIAETQPITANETTRYDNLTRKLNN